MMFDLIEVFQEAVLSVMKCFSSSAFPVGCILPITIILTMCRCMGCLNCPAAVIFVH